MVNKKFASSANSESDSDENAMAEMRVATDDFEG